MTMNWYLAESLIAERTQSLARADARRWPDLDRARRVQAARAIRPFAGRSTPRRSLGLPATSPGRRFSHFLRGLAASRPIAQR